MSKVYPSPDRVVGLGFVLILTLDSDLAKTRKPRDVVVSVVRILKTRPVLQRHRRTSRTSCYLNSLFSVSTLVPSTYTRPSTTLRLVIPRIHLFLLMRPNL